MGRLAFRAAWDCTDVAVVHINEIKGGPATAAHLLEFDSVHGRWSKPIKAEADGLTVEGRSIKFTAESKPNEVPWEGSQRRYRAGVFRETADARGPCNPTSNAACAR